MSILEIETVTKSSIDRRLQFHFDSLKHCELSDKKKSIEKKKDATMLRFKVLIAIFVKRDRTEKKRDGPTKELIPEKISYRVSGFATNIILRFGNQDREINH